MRQSNLRPEYVEFIPESIAEGTIYISQRYRTASHLCCCGCKLEVVTPINPAKWQLTQHPDGKVSLSPSIGNWSFPCQSHYFVIKNRIEWAGAFSSELIRAVQAADLHETKVLAKTSWSRRDKFIDALAIAWSKFFAAIKNALKR